MGLPQIKFKEGVNKEDFFKLDGKCIMLAGFAFEVISSLGFDFIITELWRPEMHPDDIHDDYRCFDLRTVGVFKSLNDINFIVDKINKYFIYDPSRPQKKCCIHHEIKDKNGKSLGWHFHFQVHPRTMVEKILNF